MRFLSKDKIKLDKTPTKLDKFVFRFVKILEKHARIWKTPSTWRLCSKIR